MTPSSCPSASSPVLCGDGSRSFTVRRRKSDLPGGPPFWCATTGASRCPGAHRSSFRAGPMNEKERRVRFADDEGLIRSRPSAETWDRAWTWNGYSLAERDRRWAIVRERAAAAELDAVLVPFGDGYDGRYLTQLLNAAVILPTAGG